MFTRRHPGQRAFTMLEICMVVVIIVIMMMMVVPSVSGLFADRKVRAVYEAFDAMVHDAQNHAVNERRPYVLEWTDKSVILRPLDIKTPADQADSGPLVVDKHHVYTVDFPAALSKDHPLAWAFWPTGTCEPAKVSFKGDEGTWTADYDPLTLRSKLILAAK